MTIASVGADSPNQTLAELALSAASEALYLCTPEGAIIYWTPSAEALFGWRVDEALGPDGAAALSPPDAVAKLQAALDEAAASGEHSATLQRCDKAGRLFSTRASFRRVVDAQDRPCLAVAERDLSELLASQDAQLRLRTILDTARDVAIIATDAAGNLTYWSAGAERLFACRHDDVLGSKGRDLLLKLTAPGSPSLPDFFDLAAKRGNFDSDFDARTRRQRPFPASIVARPFFGHRGEIDGVIAVVQDLTQRAETLKQRDEALEQAESSRQLAVEAARTKGEFLANMSHEIRTPMNAVLGMLQLLERTGLSRQQDDYVGKAQTAAKALLHIIDDILDFSKIEAGKLALESESFGVDQLLRDIAVILGANVGEKFVEILFDVDPEIPEFLLGDPYRLKQVLINLAGNALKFTQEGEVVLSVQLKGITEDVPVVEFSVRDTGIGMSQEQQARLFQAFSQAEAGTTRRFGGTGLGLVISQRLVHLMGGEMSLKSELGVGSCFSFTAQMPEGNAVEAGPRERASAELANLRVLIVDDNANAREIIAGLAESLGWHADTAANGAEAIQWVIGSPQQPGKAYDVAFIDWAMPGMHGWQVIRGVREAALMPPSSVIMVTAHTREVVETQLQSDRDLVSSVLVKPVTASDLFDAVSEALSDKPRPGPVRPVEGMRLTGLQILVAEDNPNNQDIARELLGYEGAVVAIADNGQRAIDAIAREPDRYDVVLMDIQMPEMDGFTATSKIREMPGCASLPIIAVTANVMAEDRDAGYAAGMNDYLSKPYHVDDVVETVLRLCARSDRSMQDSSRRASPQSKVKADFDFDSALQRFGNRSALFAQQARLFADDAERAGKSLYRLFESGDLTALGREAHTIRGVVATLGAQRLAQQLGAIEKQCRDGDAEPLVGLMEGLPVVFDAACRALVEKADSLDMELETAAPIRVSSETPQDHAALLDDLTLMLEQNNMRATELAVELKAHFLASLPEETEAVCRSVNGLDFATAKTALLALKERLP